MYLGVFTKKESKSFSIPTMNACHIGLRLEIFRSEAPRKTFPGLYGELQQIVLLFYMEEPEAICIPALRNRASMLFSVYA